MLLVRPVKWGAMDDYRVKTDSYSGPLGLLLYLIRRDEIDIYDIPVAEVARQYVLYVEMLQDIDPNVAGEFLIMVTVLMELKSKMLLPRPEMEEEEEEDFGDPRLELVRQLLEYKRFKDASVILSERADQQSEKWPRSPAKLKPDAPSEVDIEDVQIWDLVRAFNKVMQSIGANAATHDVVFDDTPISLHADDILDRIGREGGTIRFDRIFEGRRRPEMVGLFLALLELMRQHRVRVKQENPFDQIDVELLSSEPIRVGAEWGDAFADAVLGDEDEELPVPISEATETEEDDAEVASMSTTNTDEPTESET